MQIRHNPLSGGYCGEVPPLPIPNREVKLTCADGTAMQCGRVGSRLFLSRASDFERFLRLFCFSIVLLSYRSFIPQLLCLFTLLPLNPFYMHMYSNSLHYHFLSKIPWFDQWGNWYSLGIILRSRQCTREMSAKWFSFMNSCACRIMYKYLSSILN